MRDVWALLLFLLLTMLPTRAHSCPSVVPAKAGTHNHRFLDLSSAVPPGKHREYGSPPSRGRQEESHHPVLAIRSFFRAINRTPDPGPDGSVSTPFATSSPSNGSSSNRSNSPSSQA